MSNPHTYVLLYYLTLLMFSVLYYINRNNGRLKSNMIYAISLSTIVILFIGYREISGFFGDTGRYVRQYEWMCKYPSFDDFKDLGFSALTYVLTYLNSPRYYLVILAVLYVFPFMYAYKKHAPEGVYVLTLLTIGSFSFFGFGTNGLRNGLATTCMLVGFLNPKLLWQVVWCAVAFSMHKSSLLPIVVFFVASHYNKPKVFLRFWIGCFLLSLVTRSAIQPLIDAIDIINNDVATAAGGYIEGDYENFESGHFSQTGYRWDFLLYGVVPIILGYIYIFKRGFVDKIYNTLYCTYVGANAFWLFTIYVPYNNRFAYLSWFLYPLVIAYPLVKQENLIPRQNQKLGMMVLINYLFTFLMAIR